MSTIGTKLFAPFQGIFQKRRYFYLCLLTIFLLLPILNLTALVSVASDNNSGQEVQKCIYLKEQREKVLCLTDKVTEQDKHDEEIQKLDEKAKKVKNAISNFTKNKSWRLVELVVNPIFQLEESSIFQFEESPVHLESRSFLENYGEGEFEIATIVLLTFMIWRLFYCLVAYIAKERTWTNSRRRTANRILSFIVVAFAVAVFSPHLPGAGTAYFAGVAALIGVSFSLSAQATIRDFLSGIILIYFTNLEEGHWVKIGDLTGKIVSQNLLTHCIITYKNKNITIPNSIILGNHFSNLSKSFEVKLADKDKLLADKDKLRLHTTVTIGYDVAWQKIEKVLISAADEISEIQAPKVLQTSLDDFYVSYELNAYMKNERDLEKIPEIYSELHKKIQEKCAEEGIEILSPHYAAIRDGTQTTIPPTVST